ncbi:hypothetical protein GCM10022380_58170 [Amycolatopsis tucumanensis]|uniref:Uncharacterized protein n=1 Tax=Amycolatopsis tucumanensis TaxID=401106 RepID=A0ABP7J129_9PSEU
MTASSSGSHQVPSQHTISLRDMTVLPVEGLRSGIANRGLSRLEPKVTICARTLDQARAEVLTARKVRIGLGGGHGRRIRKAGTPGRGR